MKNKSSKISQLGRKAPFLALAGLALAGCASLPKGTGEAYQNPRVSSSYGYNLIGKEGNVDGAKHPYIKKGILYVVGYSGACASESLALDMARADAISRVSNLTNESVIRGLSAKSNEIDIIEMDGNQAYAAEVLTQVPLSSFNQAAQKNLESALASQ